MIWSLPSNKNVQTVWWEKERQWKGEWNWDAASKENKKEVKHGNVSTLMKTNKNNIYADTESELKQ